MYSNKSQEMVLEYSSDDLETIWRYSPIVLAVLNDTQFLMFEIPIHKLSRCNRSERLTSFYLLPFGPVMLMGTFNSLLEICGMKRLLVRHLSRWIVERHRPVLPAVPRAYNMNFSL